MQLAIFLSTVLVTLIALGLAFVAYREARAAESAETRIEKALARVSGLAPRVAAVEGSFESLRLQHQKLHGKFHATLRDWEADREARLNAYHAQLGDDWEPTQAPDANGAACENYAAAQRDGPLSEAAQCQCEFCIFKRRQRDELRKEARKRPDHAATVRAIEAAS